jgi:antitoxin component YwqK of YwqJK toxin-antitoxin module
MQETNIMEIECQYCFAPITASDNADKIKCSFCKEEISLRAKPMPPTDVQHIALKPQTGDVEQPTPNTAQTQIPLSNISHKLDSQLDELDQDLPIASDIIDDILSAAAVNAEQADTTAAAVNAEQADTTAAAVNAEQADTTAAAADTEQADTEQADTAAATVDTEQADTEQADTEQVYFSEVEFKYIKQDGVDGEIFDLAQPTTEATINEAMPNRDGELEIASQSTTSDKTVNSVRPSNDASKALPTAQKAPVSNPISESVSKMQPKSTSSAKPIMPSPSPPMPNQQASHFPPPKPLGEMDGFGGLQSPPPSFSAMPGLPPLQSSPSMPQIQGHPPAMIPQGFAGPASSQAQLQTQMGAFARMAQPREPTGNFPMIAHNQPPLQHQPQSGLPMGVAQSRMPTGNFPIMAHNQPPFPPQPQSGLPMGMAKGTTGTFPMVGQALPQSQPRGATGTFQMVGQVPPPPLLDNVHRELPHAQANRIPSQISEPYQVVSQTRELQSIDNTDLLDRADTLRKSQQPRWILLAIFVALISSITGAGVAITVDQLVLRGPCRTKHPQVSFDAQGNQSKEGLEHRCWSDGSWKVKGRWDKNQRIGQWLTWFDNGYRQSETNYVRGQREGTYTTWYRDGIKATMSEWQQGKLQGSSLEWYANGRQKMSSRWLNGEAEGSKLQWYENGNRKSEINYSKGKRHGEINEWRADSSKLVQGSYFNGRRCGTWNHWTPAGTLEKTQTLSPCHPTTDPQPTAPDLPATKSDPDDEDIPSPPPLPPHP